MMTPEEIVESCAGVGVILYLNDDRKLSAWGKLPDDWMTRVSEWIQHREQVQEWLKTPSEQHASRMLAVRVAQVKMRLKKPCIHLGMLIEEKPSCGCGPRHQCSIHGECVTRGNTNKWHICTSCVNFEVGDE